MEGMADHQRDVGEAKRQCERRKAEHEPARPHAARRVRHPGCAERRQEIARQQQVEEEAPADALAGQQRIGRDEMGERDHCGADQPGNQRRRLVDRARRLTGDPLQAEREGERRERERALLAEPRLARIEHAVVGKMTDFQHDEEREKRQADRLQDRRGTSVVPPPPQHLAGKEHGNSRQSEAQHQAVQDGPYADLGGVERRHASIERGRPSRRRATASQGRILTGRCRLTQTTPAAPSDSASGMKRVASPTAMAKESDSTAPAA